MKKVLILLLLCISILQVSAQDSLIRYKDGHPWCKFEPYNDNVSDQTKALPPPPYPANSQITCGAIRVTFMDVYNGTPTGFNDPTLGATRRNCVCNAMNYIQSVITFPASVNASNPVDVLFQPSLNSPSNPLLGFASPVFPPAFFSGTPGYYGGYVFDFITTGVNPAPPNTEHGQITMNFAHAFSYCSPIIGDCEYDFESVIIHEFTHLLGIGSMMTENSSSFLLESGQAPNVFTAWDGIYLYYQDAGGVFNKMVDISTFAGNGGINPVLPASMFNSITTANRVWHTNTLLTNRTNQPVMSRTGGFQSGTTLSHFDEDYFWRTSYSPAFSPNYVMNGYLNTHRFKNELTKEELRVLQGLGYTINTVTVNNYTNIPPSLTGDVIAAFPNYDFPDDPIPAGNSNLIISTTNCNPVIINLSSNTITNGSTSHPLGFYDVDGDPISVFEGQLFNLRGCGNGGNNNNQLVISGSNNIVTFTPRTNFVGRAQFAFHLSDGIDRGAYVVITIDVNQDACFNNGTEHVINGNFEEGKYIRTFTDPNATVTSDEMDVNFNYTYNRFSDGQNYISPGWQDQVVRNSFDPCLYGTGIWSFPAPGSNPPPPGGLGDRYTIFASIESFHQRLAPALISCSNYVLEADISFQLFVPVGTVVTLPIALRNTINGANLYSNSITVTHTGVGNWHHVIIPISYTNTVPANFFFIDPAGTSYCMIDNLTIQDDPSNPSYSPTITITSNPSNATICTGNSINMTASGASTYIWTEASSSTVLSTNATLTVSPTVTTTYVVTGTDAGGCTGTANITVTVNPPPIVSVTSSAPGNTLCSGEMTTLTATGALTYVWTPDPTLISSPSPGATADVTPLTTTTYTVTGTDANGCTGTSSITINVSANCCGSPGDVPSSGALSSSIGTGFPNPTVGINGNFTVDNSFTITNQTVEIAANVKIIVLNGATLTISKSSLYSCGTDMWDGIEIQPGGNLTIVNKSLIEDAKIGVLSDNTGIVANFYIQKTAFNRNYIGVKVINHTGSVHPGIIINTTFDSQPSVTSTTNTAFLDAPFASQTAEYGVELADVHSIVIGNAALAGFKNRFGYLHVGIRANKSKYRAVNNEFKNMYPALTTWGIWNTSTQALIGGYLANQPNNFENSYNGIKHETNSDLEVYKNTFTNITSPLFPLNKIGSICVFTLNIESSNVTLKDNVLTNFQTGFKHLNCKSTIYLAELNQFKDFSRWGIHGLQNQSGNIKVLNNNFNQSVYSTFNGNIAINFSNAVLPLSFSPVLTVSNNSINRINRGVEVINYDRPVILTNTVAFPATLNTSVLHYGIRTLNSDKELIQSNTVTKTGAFPNSTFLNQVYGISVEGNISRVIVTQNTVVRVGDGYRFRGYFNLNSTVSCNKMNYNYSGLTLDAVGIGGQGSSTTTTPPNGVAQDNQWTNPASIAGSLSARGLGGWISPNFYSRGLIGNYPWTPSAASMLPGGTIFIPVTLTDPLYVPSAPQSCPNICYNPPCIFFPLVKMAQDQSPYDMITGNEKYLLQQSLLKTILSDSTIQADTSADAITLRYYRDTTLTNTEFGKLAIVSDSIATGDTTFAKALNDLVFDTKCAETYQKIVNEIYLRSWARNQFFLKPSDSAALEVVAYEDPVVCGPAVYDARVMLSLDLNDFSPDTRSGDKTDENEMIVGKIGILYPNPASVSCIYEAELEHNQTGYIEMYNINGEILGNFLLKEGVNRVEMDLSPYENGVYIFKIIVVGESAEVKRLVITK